jgi:hypothetical protein
MSGPIASLVDWGALGKTVAYALVVGVGITGAFSFVIVGITRIDEARRTDNSAAVVIWSAVAIAGGAIALGGVALGLVVMAHKG